MEAVTYCGFYCKRCPEYDNDCPGCKQGGADPTCKIRLCAQEHTVMMCAVCDDYPCDKLSETLERFPFLAKEAETIRRDGVEKWVTEQKSRVDEKYY